MITFLTVWFVSCFFSSVFLLPLMERIDIIDDWDTVVPYVVFSCISVPITIIGMVCWIIYLIGDWTFNW